MPFGVLVIGPAGAGKTRFCAALQTYGDVQSRSIHVINLDPAAEDIPYRTDVDVREIVTVDDAMAELKFGPNGGLVYCMEYLLAHSEWLEEKLLAFAPEDTILFDCPGQLELYTHVPVMPRLVALMQRWDTRLCVAYMMDSVSLGEPSKFIAGALAGLSAMLQLPLPRLTVLSKTDLLAPDVLEEFLEIGSATTFLQTCDNRNTKFLKLTTVIANLLDDHSLLSYVPFSIHDEDSPSHVLTYADQLTQYTDEAEVRIPRDIEGEEEEDPDTAFKALMHHHR
ncbi:hypothetical protein CTAYLR_004030 [Chrysophaeum taylorii]|uniref:GPN-loop GTPase 3 n=1 Tax=Chrysophaeum taylorii TaxID=2483200 RepID=A0AAD7U754_9STRA|nr:hypothetical protein CTAYLR_004030 [Chrysophaeum taylorii]